MNAPWEEFEAKHVRAVPDYARWVANKAREDAGVRDGQTLTDEGGKLDQGDLAQGGFQGESQGVEPVEAVTQVLTEAVRPSELQNEISGCPLSVVSGQLSEEGPLSEAGPLSVVSGQLSEAGQLSVVSGQLRDLNGANGIRNGRGGDASGGGGLDGVANVRGRG